MYSTEPVVPAGVYDAARANKQNQVTWQPKDGVRAAIVAQAMPNDSGQVVVIGRSLRETEKRIDQLTIMVLGAWIVAIFGSLIINTLAVVLRPKSTPPTTPN